MKSFQNILRPLTWTLALGLSTALLLTGCGSDKKGGSSAPSLTLLAGNMNTGRGGSTDGSAAVAKFDSPTSVVSDSAGNVYVADHNNHTIRRVTAAGVVSTLAGTAGVTGSADGTGAAASFDRPRGLAIDSTGANLYVADKNNHTIRRVVIATGAVTTFAGAAGVSGYLDAPGAAARFTRPSSLAMDSANNIYVAETRNNYTIRKITLAGVVTTVAGAPRAGGSGGGTAKDFDATGTAAGFGPLAGIAIDSAGANLYVSNSRSGTIRKIVVVTGVVTTLASGFNRPHSIAVDGTGDLYMADQNSAVIRKITSVGVVTTFAGTLNDSVTEDGIGAAARFNRPTGLAIGNGGANLYVSERNGHVIRKIVIASATVSTLAGLTPLAGSADGTGTAARFARGKGKGVATDSAGNVYMADSDNHTIRKITAAGVVTTLAGSPGVNGNADGTGPAASFNRPIGLATDSAGNVYVSDTRNDVIRAITPAGVVTTLATGLNNPHALVSDGIGNLYVADTRRCVISQVVIATGVVSVLAGTVGSCTEVDGIGAVARFDRPEGIAIDGSGNLYVADKRGHTVRRIVIATGVVTTLAGTAGISGSTDGTGIAASFNGPRSIAVSSSGNLYVADFDNKTIRKITPAGVVTTVVGVVGQNGFTPGALPGLIDAQSVAINGNTLYIGASRGVATVAPLP